MKTKMPIDSSTSGDNDDDYIIVVGNSKIIDATSAKETITSTMYRSATMQTTNVLEDKVMEKMLEMLMDYKALSERIKSLELIINEMKEDVKRNQSQKVTKWGIWVAIGVGALQIIMMLLQLWKS